MGSECRSRFRKSNPSRAGECFWSWTLDFGLCPLGLNLVLVLSKSQKIARLIDQFEGKEFDPHYLGFFHCFNRQLYFEAHEVLEPLWLRQRGRPIASFYKGLIQLAGAFVHLQKNRRGPAIALFGLARQNLEAYPAYHEGLDLGEIHLLIERYLQRLQRVDDLSPLFRPEAAPKFVPRGAAGSDPLHDGGPT